MQLYYDLDSPIGKSVPPKRGRSDYVPVMVQSQSDVSTRPTPGAACDPKGTRKEVRGVLIWLRWQRAARRRPGWVPCGARAELAPPPQV